MESVFHIYIAHTVWENNSFIDLKMKMLSLQRSGNDTYVTYFWREITLFFSVRGASFARIFFPIHFFFYN